MASIGLRINQPGSLISTKTAELLAQAMGNNPELEAKLMAAQSDRQTDLYRQNLLHQQAITEGVQRDALAAQEGLYTSQAAKEEALRQSELGQQRAGSDWAAKRAALAELEMPVPVADQFLEESARPEAGFVGPMPIVVDQEAFDRERTLRDARVAEARAGAGAIGSTFTDSNASQVAEGQGEFSGRLALEESMRRGEPVNPNAAILYRQSPPTAASKGNAQIYTDPVTQQSYFVDVGADGKPTLTPINDPGAYGGGTEVERAKSRITSFVGRVDRGATPSDRDISVFQGDLDTAWPVVPIQTKDRDGNETTIYERRGAPAAIRALEKRFLGNPQAPAPATADDGSPAIVAEPAPAVPAPAPAPAPAATAAQPAAADAAAAQPAVPVPAPPQPAPAAPQVPPATAAATANAGTGSPDTATSVDPENHNAIVTARQAYLARKAAGTMERTPDGSLRVTTKEAPGVTSTADATERFININKIRQSVAYVNSLSKMSDADAKVRIPPFALKLIQDPSNPAAVVIAGKQALPRQYDEYIQHIEVMVNAILRDETGAAAAFGEKPGAEMRFAPQATDTQQTRRQRMSTLWGYIHNTRLALQGQVDQSQLLDADNEWKRIGLNTDISDLDQADQTGAPAVATDPGTGDVIPDAAELVKPPEIEQAQWDEMVKDPAFRLKWKKAHAANP